MKTWLENVERWIVWHLPRRMCSWAVIRVVAETTTGEYSGTVVPDLPAMEAVRRWDQKK